MTNPILPGATLGVLGSGQLGRMFAIAARRLGYRVHVYSPDVDTPAGQVADREFSAAYDDLDQLAEFARSVDVVTFEFENVPAAVTDCIQKHCPVFPSGYVLSVAQNRIREKSTLRDAGLVVPEFLEVNSAAELRAGVAELGVPSVVKSASWGYDGKGQAVIHDLTRLTKYGRLWRLTKQFLNSLLISIVNCPLLAPEIRRASSFTMGRFAIRTRTIFWM